MKHITALSTCVEVLPRLREYVPYLFAVLGAPTNGYGDSHTLVTPEQRLAHTWRSMMHRCYDPNHQAYAIYGAAGISICKRWHTVGAFVADVQRLHGWGNKLSDWEGYQLDKDYYSSNQYSPDTCVWLSKADNTALKGRPIYATDRRGKATLFLSQREASEALGIAAASLSWYLKRATAIPRGQLAGYTFEVAADAIYLRKPLCDY